MSNIHMNDPYKDFCNWHHVSRDCPTVCHLWLKVSWGSFQSPMVTWITIFMNNPWHWALNEIRLGEHSYSETTSGEAGDYAQNFIFEQKRKEEKT